MGSCQTKGSWQRHKHALPRGTCDALNLEADKKDAEFKMYYVCQGFGKAPGADGRRMFVCTDEPVTHLKAHQWIAQKVLEEPKAGNPRRIWESPYIYTMVQTDSKDFLADVLGTKPVFEEARLTIDKGQ
jgi:hypothetical protein